MQKRPLFLFDMREAIADLKRLSLEFGRDGLLRDRLMLRSFERCFEIISEASRRIPEAWKTQFPEIPWPKVAAIGNRLRHNYDVIDLDTLLVIAEDDLPLLEDAVQKLIAQHDVQEK